jgi:glutamine synthetase
MKFVEYVWLDADNNFRSKIRVVDETTDFKILDWNYDGSSTNQATTESSEIILKPVDIFKNPFIDGFLAICATYDINNKPLTNNHYHNANIIFNNKKELQPWFGLEQEYFIFEKNKDIENILNNYEQGKYYCSMIEQDQKCVEIATEHMVISKNIGLKISGINAEVAPFQWEFQIGPCEGIEAGNHLFAARYILERIASKYNYKIYYEPKLYNKFNGSGCHTNFSTINMREENGLEYIMEDINKLNDNHSYHMENYGENNRMRMTGHHETASYDKFTWGVGSRNTSIRIGYDTFKNKKGYFEDRRPASNIDPYLVTSLIFKTCCL